MFNTDSLARVFPFALYIALMSIGPWLSPYLGRFAPSWYGVQIAATVLALRYFWPHYSELHSIGSNTPSDASPSLLLNLALSVACGALVFVLWIHLDIPILSWGQQLPSYIPVTKLVNGVAYDWPWIVLRIAGSSMVVPVMEELFWRSFLMRWLINPNFTQVAANSVSLRAILLSAIAFGLEHNLWCAGLIAGIAYAWLYRRANLWCAILAHALTNLLLGVWIVATANWQFW